MKYTYYGSAEQGCIYSENGLVTDYSMDRKQNLLMCKIVNEKFKKGWKMFYAATPTGLCFQIEKALSKN